MTTRGMIEASTTRRPVTPATRPSASVTASSPVPIRQVPEAWYDVPVRARRYAASSSSVAASAPGPTSSPR